MPTFHRLIQEIHARGLRLILDYIPNHTSDQHVWFQESRSSRTNPRRDWFIWRDAAVDGGPPNNWRSELLKIRPLTTLAGAVAVGFLLGAIWKL